MNKLKIFIKTTWLVTKPVLKYFVVIVIIMASMDSFNFYFPHNNGWLSLTYGTNSNNWDAWHILKRLVFFVYFISWFGFQPNRLKWWSIAIIFALTAYFGQIIVYDVFTKLF